MVVPNMNVQSLWYTVTCARIYGLIGLFHCSAVFCVLAPMLLAFTTRRMVWSAHRALSPKRFTVRYSRFKQIFLRENTYCIVHMGTGAEMKIHTASYIWAPVLRWAHLAFPARPYAYKAPLSSKHEGFTNQHHLGQIAFKIIEMTALLSNQQQRYRPTSSKWSAVNDFWFYTAQ